MHYISTRGQTRPHTFSEAVEAGLAPDGGLFLPEKLPGIADKLPAWSKLTYPQLAAEFFTLFAPEISNAEWHQLTAEAYRRFDSPDVAPLRKITDKTYILELFHGPTLAFKDFALQLLGLLYKRQVAKSGKRLAVLGATSGDTGSAAIHGCMGQDGITIFILYPNGRVAPLQERQMACTGAENVFAIPVPGTFDDAQRVVKDIFGDTEFASAVNLSAVNSINIARVLAQCVYYIWACLRLPEEARATAEYVVPTGNFGNVLAGWLAQQMGMPAGSFRVATNQNDILHRFFSSGEYRQEDVHPSHAPSMDIQAASNFERFLYYILDQSPERVREVMVKIKSGAPLQITLPKTSMHSTRMDDAQIERVIAQMWQDWQYVLDPHTACAFTDMAQDRISVVLSTASPAKFPDVVKQATGNEPTHPTLEALKSKPLKTWPMNADPAEVKAFIRRHKCDGSEA
ncbi:threonine synthase [Prosthecobacter sp.]|jgi:threonine synthase|uniref:threonine synthase n=1 Tax=Prosthecobacter sp. TaxID=1965333 RepID=UPI0037843814